MAEQEIYGNRFGGTGVHLENIADKFPRPSGAASEQDIFGSHFRPDRLHHPPSHQQHTATATTSALGLLQTTVLPSFTLHAGFSTVAYGLARFTNRVEGKDWLWPAGITANAWWNAIGNQVINESVPFADAWSKLDYSQKLLLGGVSAWGLRLLYRVVSRSVRRGEDDPRYKHLKKDKRFWHNCPFTMFLPEALFQTLIGLPFTLSFGAATESGLASPAVTSTGSLFHGLAIFLFSSGLALETLADAQLEAYERKPFDQGILRDGVWSIVRHPNYLGDALIHASFPILLLSANLLHPIALLGPIANYVFLRHIGGDKENEATRAQRYAQTNPVKAKEFEQYQQDKNSFWPDVGELKNKWALIVAAVGVGGVLIEQGARALL